jgi:NAD(P) transhydrogenase subunit alpha
MSEDYKKRQAELSAETIRKQDIVICTALIPGRPAPTLVTREMVETMKPGSIIVDLAVERGGNCPLSKPGKVVMHKDVKIMGYLNVAGRLPVNASSLYAKNVANFVELLIDRENGTVAINWDDEIIAGTALTRDGAIVHPSLV